MFYKLLSLLVCVTKFKLLFLFIIVFWNHSTWGQSLLPLMSKHCWIQHHLWFDFLAFNLEQIYSHLVSHQRSLPHVFSLFFFFTLFVVLPALVDRLGDGKDQVRENSQALILRLMDQTTSPMVRHMLTWADKSCMRLQIKGIAVYKATLEETLDKLQ